MHDGTRRPRGRMLRFGRKSLVHQIYLVTAVTHDREPLFHDFALGRIVVQALRFEEQRGQVLSLAFVVMPDHVHWLLELRKSAQLNSVMHAVKGYSGRHINAARGTFLQRIWQAGFHDHAIRREEDLRSVARYMVANPVRAGLVRKVGDYPLWDAVWI